MPTPRLIRTPEWFKSPETQYPDVASVVRRRFATVKEAEDFARSLGVSGVDYESRLDIAQLANEFLARLQDRSLQVPMAMMVHSDYFAEKYPDDLRHIPAMAEGGVVFLNPGADLWQDPLEKSRNAFALRYWSTPSPLHVFFHEYAHLYQKEATRNRPLTPKQTTMAFSISIRARDNLDEFLSEVYAGLIEGVQYDADIMKAYYRSGGKKP